ncbi:MAG: ABC transporter permease subunit [Acidilobus sp.]|nr:ABC transporter permease subunit [Acidilobus sp.]MCG2889453.1 ABC transporter permease subunit [Acidilobus sp.]MCG2890871.1 ABC transporter permease subunit [Acidilobus sp.]
MAASRSSALRTVIWKELIDIGRDRRALALMILIPLVGLPLMALIASGLSSAQVVTVYFAVLDNKSYPIVNWLSSQLRQDALQQGLNLNITISSAPPSGVYDVEVIVPYGFYDNLSKLDGVAVMIVRSMVGNYASQEVTSLISSIVSQLSNQIVVERVEELAKLANVSIVPSQLLNPIQLSSGYYLPSGAAATQQQVQLSFSVRLLEFSLFFVVNPAIVLVTDSFLGEKERKTLEVLLSSPIPKESLVLGKLTSAAVMGFIIALADSGGVIIYFLMLAGYGLRLTPTLLMLNLVDAAVLVFMTSALVTPIILRSPSIRAAQASSYAVMMVALGIYFSALFVNVQSLPTFLKVLLLAIPFTEASTALTSFVLGQATLTTVYITIMLGFSAAFTIAAFKALDVEKLTTSK